MAPKTELERLREVARRKRPESRARHREVDRAYRRRQRKRGGRALREKEAAYAQRNRALQRTAKKELESHGEGTSPEEVARHLVVMKIIERDNELIRQGRSVPLPPGTKRCPQTGATCLRCEDNLCFLQDPHYSLDEPP